MFFFFSSETVLIHGEKSSEKGIEFEWVLLSNFTCKTFQDKPLSELPFISKLLGNKCPQWLKDVQFHCKGFGTKEMYKMKTDVEFLTKKNHFFLKPENVMHPDGILVLKQNEKFYFLVSTVKTSYKQVVSKEKKKNINSGDLRLIYCKNIVAIKPPEEEKEMIRLHEPTDLPDINGRTEFFNAFPSSKIGGIIRLVFEFDTREKQTNPIIVNQIFPEDIMNNSGKNYRIPQIIISITNETFKHFFVESAMIEYFNGLVVNFKRSLKIKEEKSKQTKYEKTDKIKKDESIELIEEEEESSDNEEEEIVDEIEIETE